MISTTLAPNPFGFTHKFTVVLADLTAAGATTSTTIRLLPATSGNLPIGTVVTASGFRVTTAYATSGSVTAVTLKVGPSGNDDGAIASIPLQFGTLSGSERANYVSLQDASNCDIPIGMETADYILATFTTTGDNLNTVSAGQVEIYVGIENLADLAND